MVGIVEVAILVGHRKASGNLKAASLQGSGSGAARTPRLWLPYAGITRIRFEGFSNLELSVRFTHTPSLISIIGLLRRTVKSRSQPLHPWQEKDRGDEHYLRVVVGRKLLLLANVFRRSSSFLDHLLNRFVGV